MNSCAIQQNAFAACDESGGPLVCPKPRRIRPDIIRAEVDLLDIFLSKGEENLVDSPFLCGSPPSRSANPIVNDSRFGELVPVNDPVPVPAPVPVLTRTGYAWAKFGFTPATVRVEGFNCLDRNRNGSRGIPAVA